jgi:hypothetical protein
VTQRKIAFRTEMEEFEQEHDDRRCPNPHQKTSAVVSVVVL